MRILVILLLLVSHIPGQIPPGGVSLKGRVLDPSDAAVADAPVVLQSGDERVETRTNIDGHFRFDALHPGAYGLKVAIPAFDPIERRVRVGSREPRPLTIRLSLARFYQELSVASDQKAVSTESGGNADVISVERTMLDSLPVLDLDYLAALGRFLDPGSPGGSGTSIIVDGMEMRNVGVTASAIQEIRINNNPYTAEYPRWSRRRIEVITKSSADAYHGAFNFVFRDFRLNARDALALERPREQRRIYEGSLFGPAGRSKSTSFLLSAARQEEDLVAVVFARGLQGAIKENVPTPQVDSVASLRISHQLGDEQAVFIQYNFQDRWRENAGVGGAVLAEAGSQTRFREDELIFNHRAVISPALLSQFRILLGRYWSPTRSNLDAPGVRVTGAFTGGGAQADRLATEAHTSITWLLTQTAGSHTMKYGFNVPDWSRRGLSDRTNALGTLSFASLAEYESGRPFSQVIQRGDPRVIFFEKNVGAFFQDEWRLRSNLSVAAGLRYDWQNYFGDRNNFAPRLAVAYAPGNSPKTVLRAGAGFFFDRSGPAPIQDIRRFDGVQLRRYVLTGEDVWLNPGDESLLARPASLHRLSQDAELPNTMQFSVGVERQLAAKTTLAVNYVGTRGVQQFRSRDVNAPLPPDFRARPNPGLNVLREIESAGRVEGNSLEVTLRGTIAPGVTGTAQYVFGKTQADTGGLNWFPADSFAPRGEWGRTDADRRHRFEFLGTASLHRWLNFGLSASLLAGIPFNVTTGRDDNGDGLALDRPAGVARNTGRGPGLASVDLRWYREFRLRPAHKEKSPSVTLSVDAFNLFNRVNAADYVGALTSPFFGQAVATHPPRRLQLGLRYAF